jgi:23S rRNA pseudouridine1911/1915/1917 synthase
MDIPILYEDDDLLVVNKPPGVVVNRAESVKGETVQDWAESYLSFPRTRESGDSWGDSFESRAGIAHRIDKETSGILLIGKNPAAFEKLQADFKERFMKKTYVALVHGKLTPDIGEVNAPIGRLPWDRERFGVDAGGKEAVTKFKVQRSWFVTHGKKKEEVSLVELYPETGRTHQIRVHMKYLNHPLIGDYLYAGRKTSRDDRVWAGRCMLHAWKITLTHPTSGASLAFEAPIPDDMERIIA